MANSLRAEQNRLFDGKTLDGWDFDEQHWRVEDGEIVGEIPSGQHLSYNTWIIWKGPKLEGTGAKGIEYIVENILNPNAVIGEDFLARQILNLDGVVMTGVVMTGVVMTGVVHKETDSTVKLRAATSTQTVAKEDIEQMVAKEDIEQMVVSKNSFMPEGLIKQLTDRERTELLMHLMSLK